MQEVNHELAIKHGLTTEEYNKIIKLIGRNPNLVELGIFSAMWNEHCSYKSSRIWLQTLPTKNKYVIQGPGENAGVVDFGDGDVVIFKIESHNHPSAIEPFQGAATGVGGIHRDIFTMGARPIAALNSLRFGNLDSDRMKHLVRGVVHGISFYGNCFGVPTVGGEVYFNESYNHDILVNAMSAGIVKIGETVSACADGPGNPVLIVGSATGKDGIHGATFASAELTEDSAKDLPAVQVGDPFQEKLLLEATLEAIKTGAIVGMQDMGAAGITCSTSEMSAKSGTGMRIDLDKVPTRQQGMKPFEILLSESQERMLIVCKKGQEKKLIEVFDKWDLECAIIGVVTKSPRLQYFQNGELVADVPAKPLVLGGGAPVYERKSKKPKYLAKIAKFTIDSVKQPVNYVAAAKKLWKSPNIASKRWIYEQYDSMIRTNTQTTNAPSDAAVVRVKGTDKSIALTTDCNSAYVYADPHKGAMIAVAEAARNIVCSGGEPVAITNCLNFGNPYNPEVFYQFANAVQGMGEACRKFNTPVTGGNVSFYNQANIRGKIVPVYPTPTIGMLGVLDDSKKQMTLDFKNDGDLIYLVGKSRNDLGSSEYLRFNKKVKFSNCPHFELQEEFELQQTISKLISSGLISSAHDVAEGGLFATLVESAMIGNHGFAISSDKNTRKDAFLFGESQSRVVVSVSPGRKDAFEAQLKGKDFSLLGKVEGSKITIDGEDFGAVVKWKKVYDSELEKIMESDH